MPNASKTQVQKSGESSSDKSGRTCDAVMRATTKTTNKSHQVILLEVEARL
jgi:hypothetical protein